MQPTYLQITHIRGGTSVDHKAIKAYRWKDKLTGKTKWNDREKFVEEILRSNGMIRPFVQIGTDRVYCKPKIVGSTHYLETYPNATQKDNLLNLPQF